MTNSLQSWRGEIPDRRYLHLSGEPFARRDAAAARENLQRIRRYVVTPRRARVARGLVGDRTRRPATCWRRSSACSRTRSRCTRTSPSRRGSSRRAFAYDGPAPQDRDDRARVPVEHVSVRGVPPLRRRDRLRALADRDPARSRAPARRDRRATRCWCRCRSCSSRAPASRCAGRDREGARVGAHVILDVYQAAGTVPLDDRGAGSRLRRRRLGEVAVRRAGRRVSLRSSGSRARRWSPASSAGRRTNAVRVRDRRRSRYADAPERFQSGTPNVPSLYSARAGYEIVATIGVAGHP